jgi:hypothetical protein
MSDLFAGGRIVDLIIAGVALEAVVVLAWRAAFGRGPAPTSFLSNLLSGAFLLIALRNALVGAGWPWIALCLLAALVAHIADLIARWERAGQKDAEAARQEHLKATISLRVPKSRGFRPNE